MAIISIYISIITLNVKKLNSIETHKIAEWTKKKKEKNSGPEICFPTRELLQPYRHPKTDSHGMEKDTQANGNQKTASISILTSDDIDFELTMLQGQRRSLYNDKKKTTKKRQSIKKTLQLHIYICTQYQST